MMQNLFLTLQFDGSAFHGWQVQPNAFTVQEALENAIARVTGAHAHVTGCSRTDAGVHARVFCCNFHTESAIPWERFPAALNFYLPPAVAVQSCAEVPEAFHARYDCKGKAYRYHIHNSGVRSPFLLGRAWQTAQPLDAPLLQRQAQGFVGTHDFSAFCAAHAGTKTSIRTVTSFSVKRTGDDVTFIVSANGFLYNMVRIMVGTLVDIACAKLPEDCIPELIAAGERTHAGRTAPAEGLWLWEVTY
jgi:tRNA pseudouridine38-40 synthase